MNRSIEILESHGLSKTEVRKKILDLFLQSDNALSLSAIGSSFEKLDRTTLYRTLKIFERKGIIHKAIDGTTHPKYAMCKAECNEGRHHNKHAHFHCTSCENTFCLDHLPIPTIPNFPKGHIIQDTNLILSGICPDCR